MVNDKSFVGGLGVAILLGVLGGLAVRAVASSAPDFPRTADPAVKGSRVTVSEARGDVRLLTAQGAWVPALAGSRVPVPAGALVLGVEAQLVLERGPTKITLSQGGRLSMNPESTGLDLAAESGTLGVESSGAVPMSIPRFGATLKGASFKLRLEDQKGTVSALGQPVELTQNGETQTIEPGASLEITGAGAAEAVAKPEPVVKPEPVPEVKPEPVTKPEPEPVAKPEPKPVAKPEPKPEPKPVAKPEPEPEPEPVAKPKPAPEPEPEPKEKSEDELDLEWD